MNIEKPRVTSRRREFLAVVGSALPALWAMPRICLAQDKAGFPDGYDAVQAAPDSHRVIFENSLVRVLIVTVPAPGKTEPMHHHRWPSFFLDGDTGGSQHARESGAYGRVVIDDGDPAALRLGRRALDGLHDAMT